MKRASLYALAPSAGIVASEFVVALPQRRVAFRYTYDRAMLRGTRRAKGEPQQVARVLGDSEAARFAQL